ncbi:hypothetical protein [Streptomyces sp. NPDC053431]|uniref:hypothetical protein n=1 Tax=Streptomyces sp. NPDC053431 TaxID=3365703 RepID=UPI0037D1B626
MVKKLALGVISAISAGAITLTSGAAAHADSDYWQISAAGIANSKTDDFEIQAYMAEHLQSNYAMAAIQIARMKAEVMGAWVITENKKTPSGQIDDGVTCSFNSFRVNTRVNPDWSTSYTYTILGWCKDTN